MNAMNHVLTRLLTVIGIVVMATTSAGAAWAQSPEPVPTSAVDAPCAEPTAAPTAGGTETSSPADPNAAPSPSASPSAGPCDLDAPVVRQTSLVPGIVFGSTILASSFVAIIIKLLPRRRRRHGIRRLAERP
ncbi:MAG: hypothetical protein DI534_08635 [Leifsonia xyli]|nr:MAG: hypothetical protein DI534_08635 [Leifsonia xyli]